MPRLIWIVGLGVCLISSAARSEPEVLYDSGGGTPIAPYLALLTPKKATLGPPPASPGLTVANYGLPVTTPSMSPGKVKKRALPTLDGKMAGVSPMFLVGADRWSLQWLQANRENLLEMRAVGMVVAVENQQELAILEQAAHGLQLVAMSAEQLARDHGVNHYPALIAPPGIILQ